MTDLTLILAHLTGDYAVQSNWMARNKQARWAPAIAHGAAYTLPHLAVTRSPAALAVIGGTHTILDHYDVAARIVWARNFLAPRRNWRTWQECRGNCGSGPDTPRGLATAIKIVVDNTVHLAINAASTRWL
jgi:hypothetical protein